MATQPIQNQITTLIASQGLPVLHPLFLNSILTGSISTRQQPITAIVATVKHRLLCSDINIKNNNNILSPTSSFLPTRIIHNKQVEAAILNQDVFVQVLDVEDLGRSKWDQLESLEAEKRGETMKGREIIRTVVPASSEEEEQEGVSTTTTSATESNQPQNKNKTAEKQGKGPFKLIVEDWKGTKTWAIELKKVEKIGMPPSMNIGCKLWLRKGCKVARGVLLMEPTTVSIMGGKIDTRDKLWSTEREKLLRDELIVESS